MNKPAASDGAFKPTLLQVRRARLSWMMTYASEAEVDAVEEALRGLPDRVAPIRAVGDNYECFPRPRAEWGTQDVAP